MLSLSAMLEKNKATQSTPWISLLEIQIKGTEEVIRIAHNTESVEWGGATWVAFPFEFGEAKEDSKEYPEVDVTVSNVTRFLQSYIEQYEGCAGSTAILRVIYAGNLGITNYKAEIEESFCITSSTADANWVTFKLGSAEPNSIRFPLHRYLKNHCNFRFKSCACGYVGTATTCDKTKIACEALGNLSRYGGYPSIPLGGIYR